MRLAMRLRFRTALFALIAALLVSAAVLAAYSGLRSARLRKVAGDLRLEWLFTQRAPELESSLEKVVSRSRAGNRVPPERLLEGLDAALAPGTRSRALLQFGEYLRHRTQETPRKADLLALEFSPEMDALEDGTHTALPTWIGWTEKVSDDDARLRFDPALLAQMHQTVRARGVPAEDERVVEEVEKLDEKIRRLNAQLADRREDLARLKRDGKDDGLEPLDSELLDAPGRGGLAAAPKDDEDAYTALERAQVEIRILLTQCNRDSSTLPREAGQ